MPGIRRTSDALRSTTFRSQSRRVLTKEQRALLHSILQEVAYRPRKLLFWKLNLTCIAILKELSSYGLSHSVVGVVDAQNVGRKIFDFKVRGPTNIGDLRFDTLVITEDAGKESALVEF